MLGSGVFTDRRYATEAYKAAEAKAEKAWDAEMARARNGETTWPDAVQQAVRAWDKVMGNAVPDTAQAEV